MPRAVKRAATLSPSSYHIFHGNIKVLKSGPAGGDHLVNSLDAWRASKRHVQSEVIGQQLVRSPQVTLRRAQSKEAADEIFVLICRHGHHHLQHLRGFFGPGRLYDQDT